MILTLLALTISLSITLWRTHARLRRLEQASFELVAVSRRALEYYQAGDLRIDSGYCMCGAKIEPGRSCDNHSPVDSGTYHAAPLFQELERRLAALETTKGNLVNPQPAT